jgi:DNA-binding NtrC family response regulator
MLAVADRAVELAGIKADDRCVPLTGSVLNTARWAENALAEGGTPPLLETALPEFERVLITAALAQAQGHRQDAAKLLGWGRNTLARKIREHGLE